MTGRFAVLAIAEFRALIVGEGLHLMTDSRVSFLPALSLSCR